jgi:O-glycosyl hydrolase
MKTSDSLVGGRLKDDPRVYRADGSIVLVVVNDDWGTTAQQFNVTGAGEPFSYTLPAGAVATFVLRP